MVENKSFKYHLLDFLPYLIFFTGSVIFFGFFADYVEFYQEKSSLFVFSGDYLKEKITQPGSLLVYLGKFLTTFYYSPLAGAIIISLTICLIIFMVSKIISYFAKERSIVIPIVFGTLFFVLHSSYQYLLYNSLGVLLQLVFFYLSIRYLKSYVPVIIFPLWYLFTGGFAWFFSLIYLLHISLRSFRKHWIEIISLPALSLIFVFLLKEFWLFQPVRTLIVYPVSVNDLGPQFRMFLPIVGFIILLPVIGKIKIRFPIRIKQKESQKILIVAFLCLMILSTLSFLQYDKVYKEYFHAEKLFYNGKYNELTEYLREHPSNNRLTIYLNNIALSESGRLNDQLFHFQQSPDGQTLFLKWEMLGEVLRRGGYFYYATGMINEANRWAYENMVIKGLTPEDLKMLIRTEIINGNYEVAGKYISVLKKTLFYRKEAIDFEKLITENDTLKPDSDLAVKRIEKIEHDFFSITDNPFVNLERVLAYDSLNHKAFEYKLAYLMLIEDYEGIAKGLTSMESLGFDRIPVHLQEAAMVCRMTSSKFIPDLGNLVIDSQTELRFNQFLQTFQSYGNNMKAAQPFLQQKFGNTFWYWAFYH